MKSVLKKEVDYYIQHKKEFVEKYNHKFIVLKSQNVIYKADSREKAIKGALKKGCKLGDFLVQHVMENNIVQKYFSRVY